MLLFLVVSFVLAVVGYFAWKSAQPTPVLKLKDGAKQAVAAAKDIADVNNDGKVNVQDALQVVKNAKAEVKRAKKKYGGKVKKKKTEN